MANLYFEATLDAEQLKRELRQMNQRMTGFAKNTKKQGAEMDDTFKRIGGAMAGYFSITAAKGFLDQMIQVRGEFQQLDIAMQTMLGSKAEADALMAEVVDLAAKTPFSLTELGQGAKRLLAFKEPTDQVGDSLRRLGDLAAGASAPIGDLIQVYGKVSAKGKMQAEELNQFAERGIPIISELAKVVGATDKEIYKMAEQGKIGFPELQKAIRNMTDEGGMFFNLMEKQSASLTGRISNLGDAWDRMLNELGTQSEGTINNSIAGLNYLVDNYETIIDTLKVIIATYGAYRGAIIAANLALKAQAAMGAIQAWVSLTRGIKSAKDAQIAFNLASKMNPWGLAAAGIAALITGFALFGKNAKSTQAIISDLNDSVSDFSTSGKEVSKLSDEYETLTGKTERTKDENDRLNTVMESLSKSVPDAVAEFDEYGRVLDINIGKVKEFSEAQKQAAEIQLTKQIDDAKKQVELLNNSLEPLQKVFQTGRGAYTTSSAYGGTKTQTYKASEEEIQEAAAKANKIYLERETILKSIADAQLALKRLISEPNPEPEPEPEPEPGESSLEKYKTLLSEQKKAYDEYNDTMRAARDEDKAALADYYKDLTAQGEDYEEYLKSQLEAFKGNVEAKTAIYQAAASAKIEIDPDRPATIKGRPATSKAESVAPSTQDVARLRDTQQRYAKIYESIREAAQSQNAAALAGSLIEGAYAGQELASAVGQFDKQMGESLAKMSDVAGSIGNVVRAFASGDPVAMVSGVVSVVASIGSLFGKSETAQERAAKAAERMRQVLELQNRALERQIELMNQASGDDRVTAERETLALIKQQQEETLRALQNTKLSVGLMKGKLVERLGVDLELNLTEGNETQELEDKLQELELLAKWGIDVKGKEQIMEMLDLYYELEETQLRITEQIVGTTSNDITDSIVQGFKDGKSAIEDFAQTFEDLMIDAVLNSFKTQTVMAAIEPFYAELASLMKDGGLDSGEIDYLQGMWKTISENLGTQFEGLKDMLTTGMGYDPFAASADDSLSGAIKGVSEQTASILAGQMNAIRINQSESLKIMNESVRYQAQIAANTNYNRHLESIDAKLDYLKSDPLKAKGL